MQKKIVQSSATYSLGLSIGKKLFKILSGEYAGKMIMISHTSTTEIKFSYSNQPYTSWSTMTSIASDSADMPSDAVMDSSGNVYVIYTDSNNYFIFKKLTFSSGTWSVGSAVTVYNAHDSFYPSIVVEPGGKLWVGWAKVDTGSKYLCVKSSSDGGSTWGTGPPDDGDVLTGGLSSVYSKLVVGISDLHVIYSDGATELAIRSLPLSGGGWTSKYLIASGTEMDNNFDANISSEGLLAVVFDTNELKYCEYDGSNWGAVISLDSNECFMAQLLFINKVPFIIYSIQETTDEYLLKYVSRKSGSFSSPAVLDNRTNYFDSVLLYDASAATFADLTGEASESTTADVYHPSSNGVLKDVGDIMYLGMSDKFRYILFDLFTAGVGGSVVYSYWDGSNWIAFTPSGGNFNLDASDKKLILWDDYLSISQDWQKALINSADRFWIKIEAVTGFSTAPVGSRISAINDTCAFSVRR